MNFRPVAGSVFLVPVDDIPTGKPEVGFGSKLDKIKPEQPYKFKVVGVGGPFPYHGVMIGPEVQIGDIVSVNSKNSRLREEKDTLGFTIGDTWYHAVDFGEILGVWETNAEHQEKINRAIDAVALGSASCTARKTYY